MHAMAKSKPLYALILSFGVYLLPLIGPHTVTFLGELIWYEITHRERARLWIAADVGFALVLQLIAFSALYWLFKKPAVIRVVVVALVGLCVPALAAAQGATRRLTTIDSIRQFPGYYHLQNVLLRGEFSQAGRRILLKADENELTVQLAEGVTTQSGEVEVRGQIIDVGRLEPGDPRVGPLEGRDADRWPRPGEEVLLRVASVTPAPAPTGNVSVRGLALEPW